MIDLKMFKLAGKRRKLDKLFLLTVVVPVIASLLYFGVFASDVYVTESQFVVRSPEKPAASGLGILLQSAGFANAGEETHAAKAFAESRDALRQLDRDGAFRKAYSRPSISVFDRFNPTGMWGSFEDLFKYYESRVLIENDTTTSISTLTVEAYTPEESLRFNQQILDMSEAMINRLNKRGHDDLVRFSSVEVADAKAKAQASAVALANYRNRAGVVDPEKQATIQIQLVSKLQDQLIGTEAQLAQLEAFTPLNPQIPVLRKRMASIKKGIDEQTQRMAGGRGSLAATAVDYQRLFLDNEIAEKQLAGALASLEEARNEARRKQAYVERIVEPSLPDSPIEPRRIRGVFATLVLGLVAWGIASMLLAGVKEHGQ